MSDQFDLYLLQNRLSSIDTAIQTEETRLQEDLFGKHNRYIIPLQNKSKALRVEYDFQLIRIIDVVRITFVKIF